MSLSHEFAVHVQKWCKCELCPLHLTRKNVVLSKGKLPSPVLFIGEASGLSEDALGTPFIGESGKLLDELIDQVCLTKQFTYAVTNILACVPLSDEEGEGVRKPTKQEAITCQPRVIEYINLCKPDLIVCLGDTAARYLPPENSCRKPFKKLMLVHPAHILRMYNPQVQLQHLYVTAYNRFVLTLTKAVQNL